MSTRARKLVHPDTGAVRFASPGSAEHKEALDAGFFQVDSDDVQIRTSSGMLESVSEDYADQQLERGFATVESDEALADTVADVRAEREAGVSTLDKIGAGVRSFGNELSLGLIGEGLEKEDTFEGEAYNRATSTARTIGSGTGLAASFLIPGGGAVRGAKAGAAAVKAARGADAAQKATRLARAAAAGARTAKTAASATGRGIGKAVSHTPLGMAVRTSEKVGHKVASLTGSKVLGVTAAASLEGGIYSAAHAATNILHSDKEFSAEAIAGEIFDKGISGALVGGAFGLGGGLLGKAATRAGKKADIAATDAARAIDWTSDAGKAIKGKVGSVGRGTDDLIARLEKQGLASSDEIARLRGLQKKVQYSTGKRLSDDDFIEVLADLPPKKAAAVLRDVDDILHSAAKIERSANPAARIGGMTDDGTRILKRDPLQGKPPTAVLDRADNLAGSVDNALHPNDFLGTLGTEMRKSTGISDGIDSMQYLNANGVKNLDAFKSSTADYMLNIIATKDLVNKVSKASSNASKAAAELASTVKTAEKGGWLKSGIAGLAMSGGNFAVANVAALAGMNGRLSRGISKTARTVAKVGKLVPKRGLGATGVKLKDVSFDFFSGSSKPPRNETKQQSMQRVVRELEAVAANPDKARAALMRRLSDVSAVSPDLSAAIADNIGVKADYLIRNAPHLKVFNGLPGATAYSFSTAEIREFGELTNIVMNPSAILRDIENGKLTLKKVEAVRTTSPRFFARLQERVLTEITESGADMPYAKRVQLSYLFDVVGDPTMEPAFIASMQRRKAASRGESSPGPNPTAKYDRLSNDLLTETQKLSQ